MRRRVQAKVAADLTAHFCLLIILFLVTASQTSFAQSTAFTYEGRLFSSSGVPLLESVDLKFQILN
ncbi:MAG: hypothetical protein K2X47_16900, partial [Bdellovibrionales bacterium]|nr:hypothetical protein [Bdellovibrionales bacterium]